MSCVLLDMYYILRRSYFLNGCEEEEENLRKNQIKKKRIRHEQYMA